MRFGAGIFVFGVGLGYREVEFDAFGVPKGQRVRRFEQCLEVVKRLWTEDNVTFENEICKLANVTMTCRPVQKPHPPIWIAANSDAAVRRAARLGDSFFINPHATMPVITGQMALYRAELAKHGKPFPTVLPYLREIYCAKDKRTAVEMAGPYLAAKYQTYAQWGQDQVLPGQDSFRQSLEALLQDRFVLGSPEECYEQLRPCWEEAGANYLIFRTHWSGMPVASALASMRLISDELLPALRRVGHQPGALANSDASAVREIVALPGTDVEQTRRDGACLASLDVRDQVGRTMFRNAPSARSQLSTPTPAA